MTGGLFLQFFSSDCSEVAIIKSLFGFCFKKSYILVELFQERKLEIPFHGDSIFIEFFTKKGLISI